MKNHECGTAKKLCTECLNVLEINLFSRNLKSKDGYLSQCKTCRKDKRNALKDTNPEAYQLQLTASKKVKERLGKDHLKASKKEWDLKNAEHVKQYKKAEYAKNRDYYLAKSKAFNSANSKQKVEDAKIWAKNNPERHAAIKRNAHKKRRLAHRNAAVSWADKNKINNIYEEAVRLEKLTGIKFHVDHIIPLVNPRVSGLHVENNLQILTAYENMKKHNSFVEDIC